MFRGVSTTVLCVSALLVSSCTADPIAESPVGESRSMDPAGCDVGGLGDDPSELSFADGTASKSGLWRDSELPHVFPSARKIRSSATPLLEDLPGRVRMIAFWGEPGAQEPWIDTPLTFLGADGRWRQLTQRELDGGTRWATARSGSLSPDGTRWIVESDRQLQLLDFGTGQIRNLSSDRSANVSWSPDSRFVALWSWVHAGVQIFNRAGRRVASPLIKITKSEQLFVGSDRRITIFDLSEQTRSAVLRWRTLNTRGHAGVAHTCTLSDSYSSNLWPQGFDGTIAWIAAVENIGGRAYRNTLIDLSDGTIVQDYLSDGTPYIDDVVRPGIFVTSIQGDSKAIYAVDPQLGALVPISRVWPYAHQSGYENHAYSEFAADLIFSDGNTADDRGGGDD